VELGLMFLPFRNEVNDSDNEDDTIRIMDTDGRIIVPTSLADVPFDTPVRVRFWLRYLKEDSIKRQPSEYLDPQLAAAFISVQKL